MDDWFINAVKACVLILLLSFNTMVIVSVAHYIKIIL